MNAKKQRFEVGQPVKIGSRHSKAPYRPAVITSISPTGVIIANLCKEDRQIKFNPSGKQRRSTVMMGSSLGLELFPLNDDETLEQLAKERKHYLGKLRSAEIKKQEERKGLISKWWRETGRLIMRDATKVEPKDWGVRFLQVQATDQFGNQVFGLLYLSKTGRAEESWTARFSGYRMEKHTGQAMPMSSSPVYSASIAEAMWKIFA